MSGDRTTDEVTAAHPERLLRSTLSAVASRWPTLLAIFLAGWLARVLLLRLAGDVGNDDAIWGLLVLPLAVLARLISYVAIFLVVREALAARDPGHPRVPVVQAVLDAILPFFIIYAAWSMIDQDVVDYARSSLDQIDFDTARPGEGSLSVQLGVLSVSLVTGAFVLRTVLGRVLGRAPRWTGAFAVYLEAVWVLVAVLVLRSVLSEAFDEIGSLRLVAWVLDGVASLRESFAWVGSLVDGIGPVWGVVSDVVLLPLAWLALAGVVFAPVLGDDHARHDHRAVSRVRDRYGSLTGHRRRVADWSTAGIVERWEPVRRVATLAWRAGPVPVASYLVAFAVVEALRSWLDLGLTRLLGPHEVAWWRGVSGTTELALDVLVVPLQLGLVASALFYLSATARGRRQARRGHPAPAPVPSAAGAAR